MDFLYGPMTQMRHFLLFLVEADAVGRVYCREKYEELQRGRQGAGNAPPLLLSGLALENTSLFHLCFLGSWKLGGVTSGLGPSLQILLI